MDLVGEVQERLGGHVLQGYGFLDGVVIHQRKCLPTLRGENAIGRRPAVRGILEAAETRLQFLLKHLFHHGALDLDFLHGLEETLLRLIAFRLFGEFEQHHIGILEQVRKQGCQVAGYHLPAFIDQGGEFSSHHARCTLVSVAFGQRMPDAAGCAQAINNHLIFQLNFSSLSAPDRVT